MSKECIGCNTENEDSATKCRECGYVFSDSNSSSVKKSPTPILIMTDMDKKSGKIIRIDKSCLIGREGDVEEEYFAEDMHISRRHCNVILENSEYKIEHLSKVTPTKINNIELSRGLKKIIRNGDTLTIADKTFEISICNETVCEDETSDNIKSVNDDTIEEKTYFVIICPKCGFEYDVNNIEESIDECSNCSDEYDKYEIKKVKAKIKYAN